MAQFETTIVFGEAAVRTYAENGTADSNALSNIGGSVDSFAFKTQGEVDAFHLGLSSMNGYFDYAIVKDLAG